MKLDKKALKARLLARYANQLDEILEELDSKEEIHLTEIEEMALKLRQEVGESITEEIVVNESQSNNSPFHEIEARKHRKRQILGLVRAQHAAAPTEVVGFGHRGYG